MHPLAWVCWLAGVLVALSALRNPLHLGLALLCIATVHAAHPPADRRLPAISPLRIALALTIFSALFNALSARFGATVLLRVPGEIPLLSGPITLEALVFGALNGLTLAGLVVAFGVAQGALPTSALIGLIPRAFYPLAVVSAIAITFVPTTLRHASQIREAQLIRGHQIRRLRDWLPLLMPLLVGGLEQAFQLAEAIAARGFASGGRADLSLPLRAALVGALALLLSGWLLALAWGQVVAGQLLMLAGGSVLIGLLWRAGRRAPRTRYQQIRWGGADSAVLIGAIVVIGAILLPLPAIDRAALTYYPYPALQPPPFDPLLGFATLGLAWPATVRAASAR